MSKNKGQNKVKFFLFALYVCTASCFYAPQAQAWWFLDDILNMIQNKIGSKITEEKNNIEAKISKVMENLNVKMMKGAGGESMALYRDVVGGNITKVLFDTAKGQYAAGNFSADGFLNSLANQLGDMQKNYALMQKHMQDAIDAAEKEKLNKEQAIQKQLVILESQRSALNTIIAEEGTTPERAKQLEELDTEIASLSTQRQRLKETDILKTEKVQQYQQEMTDLQGQIDKAFAEFSPTNLEKEMDDKLAKQMETLFGDDPNKDTEKDVKELYETAISKLFLEEGEEETSKNIKRVRDARKREYYDAVKNAFETVILANVNTKKIHDRSAECLKVSANDASTNFGAMGTRQCVEMQNAIAAADYMEILLAMIQLDTTAEMQMWDNKYKLQDYDRDFTKFNLDDYDLSLDEVYDKVKKQTESQIYQNAYDHVKDFF